jgi:serine/threonine protein kinase
VGDSGRRFRFLQCLGSGGFGEVYLATMTSASGVETEVAVKMLHEGLDPRSQAVQRLRDEGRLLGSLNHPSVLKVHDLVLLEGRVALVMEYVAGLDLEQCVELTQPIGLRAGMEVVAHVADALHVAYDSTGPDGRPLQLVHRDIKPPNIRIGLHGEVKVLDFGIAKAADARREAKTQTSVMIGSPWYMAPERFDGQNDGSPADVYALGCSLYEIAARGGRLFSELSSREHFLLSLDDKAHDQHVRDHLHPLAIPTDVRWLLDRMLAYDPAERPTHAEVAERAERIADGLQGDTLRRWCKGMAWPDAPMTDGALVGQEVTEHRLSTLQVLSEPEPEPALGDLRSLPTFDSSLPEGVIDVPPVAPPAEPARQVPAITGRGRTPPLPRDLPVPPRRRNRPVPVVNHLIVPGMLVTIAVSTLSVFGFFFLLCMAVLAA